MAILTLLHHFNPRPREGSDPGTVLTYGITVKFQSTLPRGERQDEDCSSTCVCGFQSTLPRGERPHFYTSVHKSGYFNPRSREGSDSRAVSIEQSERLFQSTLPRGERPSCSPLVFIIGPISIHAPARGATNH